MGTGHHQPVLTSQSEGWQQWAVPLPFLELHAHRDGSRQRSRSHLCGPWAARCPGVGLKLLCSPGSEQPRFCPHRWCLLPDPGVALNFRDGASAHISDVCFQVRSSPLGHLSGLQTCLGKRRVLCPLASAGSSTPRVEQACSPRGPRETSTAGSHARGSRTGVAWDCPACAPPPVPEALA